MMKSELHLLSSQFKLLKLNITVQLKQSVQLPPFKGAMWHGLFGHAFKAHDERLYQVFYGEHAQQQPKPYAIFPDGDHKEHWHKGELLSVELTVFGEACEMAPAIVETLQHASNSKYLGIGDKRASFKVLSVSSNTPYGLTAGIKTLSLQDWLPPVSDYQREIEVALHFVTPVRAKHQGQVIKDQAPQLAFWLNQTLRRLTQISRFWVVDDEAIFSRIYEQMQCHIPRQCDTQSDCYFEDWLRYSARHEKRIPIGGLKGQVSFYGELGPLLPLLKIGELLQVGGKTTFGLGKYKLIG
ncbi:hypothetical protein BCU93_03375 [Vibrio breoganii]|uniref:CRISPR system precrRNA processing endoribonuclease RAMP protein Cas6 n=1 Tax=Vibrio breoganii TaxID=553239 RepID=UPI000C82A33F|nr:CRISPR system precrRNA processing endoribonuclease RAMP protein Cas6 [Vibrio breoganii]PMG33893.1 hypothetical protein BCU93_03375 [Vibrio breoganii]